MEQALEGIKIADFSWAITGPLATKWLGDHGATVVRIESMQRVDVERNFIPMAQGIPGINRCGSFAQYNTSKYSIALNLKLPEAQEVARRIVAWSDIVIENFGVGVMERWNLSYDKLRDQKQDIIMVSATMQGQTGPQSKQGGLGILMQGLAGFTHLVGWPDRSPVGVSTPYTDYIGPWYIVATVIAALDYRDRTSKGQYIDMSQFETAVNFLAPKILEYAANGRVANRMGNRCSYAAPHGVFQCKGTEKWCAITIFTSEEWRAFCTAIGNPEWCRNSKFATLLGRKRNEDELEELVGQWTIKHAPEEVMAMLQAVGVPAGVVESAEDISNDPQLNFREHLETVDHSEMGLHACESRSFRLSRTPAPPMKTSPLLGQHTEYVCKQMLAMPDEEFIHLWNKGVFE
jgi:benzylsuccinate CoA-transferase BbsF subunit